MSNFAGPVLLSIQREPSQIITIGLLASKNSVGIVPDILYSHAPGSAVAKPDAKDFSSKMVRSLC